MCYNAKIDRQQLGSASGWVTAAHAASPDRRRSSLSARLQRAILFPAPAGLDDAHQETRVAALMTALKGRRVIAQAD